jgi:hypothetical protein
MLERNRRKAFSSREHGLLTASDLWSFASDIAVTAVVERLLGVRLTKMKDLS